MLQRTVWGTGRVGVRVRVLEWSKALDGQGVHLLRLGWITHLHGVGRWDTGTVA